MLATSSKLILNSFMINKNNFKQRKTFKNSLFETVFFLATLKLFPGLNRLNCQSLSSSSSAAAAGYSTESKLSIFLIYSEASI